MTTKISLLNDVEDVALANPIADGHSLVYNASTNKWISAFPGVFVYSNIGDLPLSGVSTGTMAIVSSTGILYVWINSGWFVVSFS